MWQRPPRGHGHPQPRTGGAVCQPHRPSAGRRCHRRYPPLRAGRHKACPPIHKNMGRSSMSWLTSLALSFNNLRTKGPHPAHGLRGQHRHHRHRPHHLAVHRRQRLYRRHGALHPERIPAADPEQRRGHHELSVLGQQRRHHSHRPAHRRGRQRTPPAARREWSRSANSSPRWCRA